MIKVKAGKEIVFAKRLSYAVRNETTPFISKLTERSVRINQEIQTPWGVIPVYALKFAEGWPSG